MYLKYTFVCQRYVLKSGGKLGCGREVPPLLVSEEVKDIFERVAPRKISLVSW